MTFYLEKTWLQNNGLISNGKSPPYNPKLTQRAKELRKNMTEGECKLWFLFLQKHQINFQRQKVIDHYIVDVYYAKQKLVIEIDGSYHMEEDRIIYDTIRTDRFSIYNIQVIRFSNKEILHNFDKVCETINNLLFPLNKGETSRSEEGD